MQRVQKVEEQHFCRGPFKSRHDNAQRVLLVMTLFKFEFVIANNKKSPKYVKLEPFYILKAFER